MGPSLMQDTMAALFFLLVLAASSRQLEAFSCVRISEQSLSETAVDLPSRLDYTAQTVELPVEIHSAIGSLVNPCSPGSIPVYHQNRGFVRRHLAGRGKTLRKLAGGVVTPAADPVFERAVAQLNGQTRGVEGFINIWSPAVEQNAEYSLSMVRVIGGKSGRENVIEAGVHVFPERYGDSNPRLFVTWTADGFQKTGCYNTDCIGFVQLGNTTVGSVVSAVSKTNSIQLGMTFLVFQDKPTGNWFFFLEGKNVGLWPASLFNAFGKGGSITQWGGEISNVKSSNRHTGTDMGSGVFARQGLGFAAFIRDLRFVDERNKLVEADEAVTEADAAACYSVSALLSGADPLNSFFFYGGPGRSTTCI